MNLWTGEIGVFPGIRTRLGFCFCFSDGIAVLLGKGHTYLFVGFLVLQVIVGIKMRIMAFCVVGYAWNAAG